MRTRSIRTWLIAVSVAVPLTIGPAVSFADPSFGPLLAGDKLLGTAGRPPAKVGFAASDWIGGPLGYLAVWSQYTDSLTQADIYGQYLTATGESLTGDLAPWGNPFLIASHPGNQDNPIVAYDGQSYFVVWQDHGGPTTALVGRRVYGCCGTGGGEYVLATGVGQAAIAAAPRVPRGPSDVGRLLVVWESHDYYPGSQGDIAGQFFDVDIHGVVTPGPSIAGHHSMAHEWAPSVAFGSDRFLITWNSEPVVNDDAGRDIYGVIMTADGGTAWGEFPITTAPSWQHNRADNVAFNGTHFLVVWDDHRAGGAFDAVYAARVTEDGAVLDGPPESGGIPVSLNAGEGGPHAAQVTALRRRLFYPVVPSPPPSVADPWLVVWAGARTRGARIAPDGTVMDPGGIELSLSGGAQFFPGVASDGRGALVTWGPSTGGTFAQVVGQRPGTVQDLIDWINQLVAEGRLSPLDGRRVVKLLNNALALNKEGAILEALKKIVLLAKGPYLTSMTLEDRTSLILQAKWLIRTIPVATAASVDLGNVVDEASHHLLGWGLINPGLLAPEIDSDRTSRYQLLRGANTVYLGVPAPGAGHALVFRTEDGVCDDSFDVFVNDQGPLYSYRANPSSYDFPLHQLWVDGALLGGTTARITFLNRASDSCGLAATYFVRLVP